MNIENIQIQELPFSEYFDRYFSLCPFLTLDCESILLKYDENHSPCHLTGVSSEVSSGYLRDSWP